MAAFSPADIYEAPGLKWAVAWGVSSCAQGLMMRVCTTAPATPFIHLCAV